ncbi:MAG: hypothetical protein IJP96_11235 [Synergistaceae bacterium]|nr:hypothetical protein [Bacilli bacterium]MBR0076315.1 hypothetical protein [Synergistaceae bacterium]MBR0252721.1 hypothetical protein [Synergistaceae bacterium]
MCTLLAAVGAGLSVAQGVAQGNAAKAQAEAQAQAMEANAKNARAQGHDAIERGGQEELKLRRQLAQHRGTQRAVLSTEGIDINSGSAMDAQNASISEGEHDAAAIRFNAARQRWGYINQAENLEAQAANARMQGKSAARNALFGGIANGLSIGLGAWGNTKSSPLTEKTPATGYNFYRDNVNFNNSLDKAESGVTNYYDINGQGAMFPTSQLSLIQKWNKVMKRGY